MRAYCLGVLLLGLVGAGLAVAQPPKTPAKTPPAATAGGFIEQSVKSADGVRIAWRLYKATNSRSGSVVIMVPASGQSAIDSNRAWHEEAKRLAANGFHVATFDHRGVGQSTEVTPSEFWLQAVNAALVNAAGNPATKTSINSQKDFKTGYYPMLAQDLAAVRHGLDLLNDTGEVNTSTVYLYGVGTGAELGLLFLGTEWFRERQKPQIPIPLQVVTPRRALFAGSEPAGQDYGGAVWLSPARNAAINAQGLKQLLLSPAVVNMRLETPMLFVVGEKDAKGMRAAKSLAEETLSAKLKSAKDATALTPRVGRLPTLDVTLAKITKADAASAQGLSLLGTNSGAEEFIVKFLKQTEDERKGRTRQVRLWNSPLIIDLRAFGIIR